MLAQVPKSFPNAINHPSTVPSCYNEKPFYRAIWPLLTQNPFKLLRDNQDVS